MSLAVEGKGVHRFRNEAGGHRIQRVPDGERNGRVHSSTVTVSIIDISGKDHDHPALQREDTDFRTEWYSGSGAGGQHRNKHQNSVRLKHLPTGTLVTAQCRKRVESLAQAQAEMTSRLNEMARSDDLGKTNDIRAGQIGSGMRADKRRTYRFRDDRVVDHVTGKKCSCKKIMSGNFDLMW